jgi:ankyrin repeat protein
MKKPAPTYRADGINPYLSVSEIEDAAEQGDIKTLKKFVKDGGDVNQKTFGRSTLLIRASMRGQMAVVRFLLDNGAAIDEKGSNGDTALHLAVLNKHTDIVRLLLDRGASLDIQGMHKDTPLEAARNRKLPAMVKMLEEEPALRKRAQEEKIRAAIAAKQDHLKKTARAHKPKIGPSP